MPLGTKPELSYQELTSCLEYRDALVMQSTHIHNLVIGRSNKFDAYCEVGAYLQIEVGEGNYIFEIQSLEKKMINGS